MQLRPIFLFFDYNIITNLQQVCSKNYLTIKWWLRILHNVVKKYSYTKYMQQELLLMRKPSRKVDGI